MSTHRHVRGSHKKHKNIKWRDSGRAAPAVEPLEGRRLLSASVVGDVYLDANNNGAEDAGETYLAGFKVYADANHNGVFDAGEPSTVSDNQGHYNLTGLAAGTVRLAEVPQPGYTLTQPAGGFVDLALADGQVGDQDFGNHPNSPIGIIRGSIFNDANGDAVQNNGEAYQSGWTAYVDANFNGQLDAGEQSATTDSTGYFAFQGLTPGTYRIREVVQSGWTQTRPAAGYYDVPVAGGQTVVDRIFGNRQQAPPPPPPTGATIKGVVFNDANVNGVKDAGEGVVPGAQVYIDSNANGVADPGEPATTTNAAGAFAFTGLTGGTYRVGQVTPAGYRPTNPAAGFALVTVPTNATATQNFGDTQKGLIRGNLFSDANGDGVADPTDGPLTGWTVYLDLNKNFAQDAGEPATTTDASGNYAFNVAAGAYRVRQTPQAGWRPTVGTFFDFTIASGQVVTRAFGDTQNVLIGGTVFNDVNANGLKEANEGVLSGWRVYIDANNDGVWQPSEESIVTDASGNYRFTDLAAGTYVVRIVQPDTWAPTTPAGGMFVLSLSAGQGTERALFGESQVA